MSLADKMTKIVCFNPTCAEEMIITTDQKKNFLISFTKKYNSTVLPACCRSCQEEIAKLLGEESSFDVILGAIPGAGSQREKVLKENKKPNKKRIEFSDETIKAVKQVIEMGEVFTWIILRDRLEEAGHTGKLINHYHLSLWGSVNLVPKPFEIVSKLGRKIPIEKINKDTKKDMPVMLKKMILKRVE